MNLRRSNRTIRKGHFGEAFSLSPPASAIEFPEPGKLANRLADRKCFHTRKFAEDLKNHYSAILTNNDYANPIACQGQTYIVRVTFSNARG